MKDYAEEFRRRIDEIDRDSKKILIINAGSMNHGKSSLFNSLLDRNAFAENDVRETVVSKDEPWIEDVYLIDTPGLNAEESDDVEAYAAYKRANMIVFVHTLKVGELKRNELNAINIIKGVLGEKYFWNHFCLAMTFLDAEKNDENINAIVDKTLNDIANAAAKTFRCSSFQTLDTRRAAPRTSRCSSRRAAFFNCALISDTMYRHGATRTMTFASRGSPMPNGN